MPAGEFSAEDWLDDDGVTDAAAGSRCGFGFDPEAASVHVDFTGSSPQVAGSVNAVRAITLSACFYMLRCLLAEDAPATAGILRPLTLITPQAASSMRCRRLRSLEAMSKPRSASWMCCCARWRRQFRIACRRRAQAP